MEDGAGRGLECPKTMDGKASNGNGLEKEIPSCCLKAKASIPESEAKCHSTVVSGWFSASQTCSGHYLLFVFCIFPTSIPLTRIRPHCLSERIIVVYYFYFFLCREIRKICLFQQPNVAR